MAAPAVSRPSPARQGHQRRRGEEQFQAVVVDARGQLVADQAGGHGVEHAPVGEPPGRCDAHTDRVEVVGASRRQRSEYRALDVDARTQMAVAATDDLIDQGAVVGEGVEVTRAAQQQGVLKGALEMAVRSFDGAVLVRLAAVVARRRHVVVRTQCRVALGGVLPLPHRGCGRRPIDCRCGVPAESRRGSTGHVGDLRPGR